MSKDQITLTDYDAVVAVTQDTVNEGLADSFAATPTNIALYWQLQSGKAVPVTDPSKAEFSFTGTLGFVTDQNGNPIDMVTLCGSNECVWYTVTFSEASFSNIGKAGPAFAFTQGTTPWTISFSVSLAFKPTTIDKLPAKAQQMVEKCTANLAPNSFAIQQLCIETDNNTWQYLYDPEIPFGGPDELIGQGMFLPALPLLIEQVVNTPIVLGFSVQYTGGQPQPTFMPTALDVSITPYTDTTGAHSNPSLDTLNILVMTNNDPLPDPPTSFGFNWVDDPSLSGTIAVKNSLALGQIVGQLNPILAPLCLVAVANADENGPSVQLQAGTSQTFDLLAPPYPENALAASFGYDSEPPTATWQSWDRVVTNSASASYSPRCSITTSPSGLHVMGSISSSGQTDSKTWDGTQNIDDIVTMPNTTFDWSVDLQLHMNDGSNGGIGLAMANANFSSPPVVENESSPSWWEQFLNSTSGTFQTYANDLNGLQGQVSSAFTHIQISLKVLDTTDNFVFLANQSFAYSNPQFTNTSDLAANITPLMTSGHRRYGHSLAGAVR